MGTEEFDLNHRVYQFGAYGKYFLMDLTEGTFSPYVKVMGGVNFSKLVTKASDGGTPIFRELSYDPTIGVAGALGVHIKTNEFGAVYLEGVYHYDMMDGITGEFQNIEYEWGDNNQFLGLRAGVLFNIGPKE
jgi:hypothetical protein